MSKEEISELKSGKDKEKAETKNEISKEVVSETKHEVVIGGKTLTYTATAGTIILKEEIEEDNGEIAKPKASIFFFLISITFGVF